MTLFLPNDGKYQIQTMLDFFLIDVLNVEFSLIVVLYSDL